MSRRWWHWTFAIWLGGALAALLAAHLGKDLTASLFLAITVIAYLWHLMFNTGMNLEEDGDEPDGV